ncbi:MAG: DUF3568 family protein [Candidatus Omnitrophota bacterium]
MRKIFNFIIGASFLATVAASQGCVLLAGAAVGAGGYAYVTGALSKNLDAKVDKVHAASLKGLQDLGAFVVSEDQSMQKSEIHAESEDGKNINIDIEALTEQASKIKIRVGTIGNESDSLRVLKAIMSHL